MTTWVLVANRTGARIFNRSGRKLVLNRSVEHPEGRVRDENIESGAKHRTYDQHARGHTGESSPHERAAVGFARQLAGELSRARAEQGVDRIVLVAEPHFLGLVNAALDAPTEKIVVGTVQSDLAAASAEDVARRVDDLPDLVATL